MKKAVLWALLTLLPLEAGAQFPQGGMSAGVDASSFISFHEGRPFASYGISLFAAYRFPGPLTLAAGLRGETNPASSATGVSLYLKTIRSFPGRRIHASVDLEAGYAIPLPTVFARIQKTQSASFQILDGAEEPFVPLAETTRKAHVTTSASYRFTGTYASRRVSETGSDRHWYEASTGTQDVGYAYLFSRKGPYFSLGGGLSWPVGPFHRIGIRIGGGIGQHFRGIWARTDGNEFMALDTITVQQRYEKDPSSGSGEAWKCDRDGNPILFSVPVWVRKGRAQWCPFAEIALGFAF